MKKVTMHEAKTNLSKLIAAVEQGEGVTIHRGKVPVARIVPVHEAKPKRVFGALAGDVFVTEAFFEALPENELADWEA